MHVEVKIDYPDIERIDVARWLRDVADTVENFANGDDYYSVFDGLDNGVRRDFKIEDDRYGQTERAQS
jgi:hypothetical protein